MQHLYGLPAHREPVDCHGREFWRDLAGVDDIVEPDHRDVHGNLPPDPFGATQRLNRKRVIRAEEGGDLRMIPEEGRGRLRELVQPKLRNGDVIAREAVLPKRLPIAGQPLAEFWIGVGPWPDDRDVPVMMDD